MIKLPKKQLILMGIVIFLFVLFFIVSIFSPQNAPSISPQTPPNNPDIDNIYILSISPPETTPLIPGEKPVFTIKLSERVSSDQIIVNLSEKDITSDNSNRRIPLEVTPKNTSTDVLKAESIETTKPYSIYTLTLVAAATNKPLYAATFNTLKPSLPLSKNNNLVLERFLPYETRNYKLEYLENRNIYIFHFKFDNSSPLNLDEQFSQAKQAAIEFIQSKNIDPESLTVEWRYH